MTQGDRDLIERLRVYRPWDEWGDGCHHVICDEAADRLEALSAENERLRRALEPIKRHADQLAASHPSAWLTAKTEFMIPWAVLDGVRQALKETGASNG